MEYRQEIDGLRAIAVLPVILFHAGFEEFSGGYIGVDVFFVISGYLITKLILDDLSNGSFSLLSFYERRIRRIFPALIATVMLCIPFAWAWLSPEDIRSFSKSVGYTALSISNIHFYKESGYFDTESALKPLLHTWSLGVEEQFYIVFPLLMLFAIRYISKYLSIFLVVLAVISFTYSQYLLSHNPYSAFYLAIPRAWELLTGSIVASTTSRYAINNSLINQIGSGVGVALITFAIFNYTENTIYPGSNALIPVVGAALVIMFATPVTLVGKLLCIKPLVAMGLISYSAYLLHNPIFAFAKLKSSENLNKYELIYLVILTILLSFVLWKIIEKPFRRRNYLTKYQVYKYAMLSSMVLVFFGILGKMTSGFESRLPGDFVIKINEGLKSKEVRSLCWDKLTINPSISNACVIGVKTLTPKYVLIGDSHSGSLREALDKKMKHQHLAGRDYTYATCQYTQPQNTESICNKIKLLFFSNLHTNIIPENIILLQRWSQVIENVRFDNLEGGVESGNMINDGLQQVRAAEYIESIKKILASGKNVYLIYLIPEMGWNVPRTLFRRFQLNGDLSASDASISYSVFKERNRKAYTALDSIGYHKNLIRIYPELVLCNTLVSHRCIAHIDGKPLYYDDDHLSEFGASLIVDMIFNPNEQYHTKLLD